MCIYQVLTVIFSKFVNGSKNAMDSTFWLLCCPFFLLAVTLVRESGAGGKTLQFGPVFRSLFKVITRAVSSSYKNGNPNGEIKFSVCLLYISCKLESHISEVFFRKTTWNLTGIFKTNGRSFIQIMRR